jgi:predicted PurR-regulated permease PerM
VSDFIQDVPEIAEDAQQVTREAVTAMNERGWIRQNPDEIYDTIQSTLLDRGQALIESALGGALNTLTRSINVLISTFGVVFIATYLLIDMPRFRQTFVNSFSHRYRRDAADLWQTLGESLSRYLGGLLVSITLQGIAAWIGLWAIGVPYAALLGIWTAMTAVLPYIGAFLGAIPALFIAFTISWEVAVGVLLLYVVINQVESNFITPRIQGSAVRVHPLLIFLAVLLGSELGGAFGAVIAVPTLAVVRVLAEFFWVRLRVRGSHDTFLAAISGEGPAEPRPMVEVEEEPPVQTQRDPQPTT